MNSAPKHLAGHLPLDAPLSPHWQFAQFPLLGKWLTHYPQIDLWERDTALLPWGLRGIRRRARTFAEQQLASMALRIDALEHWPVDECPAELRQLLVAAGKEGWLSYFAPPPFGRMPLTALRHAPVWQCALVVEEFSRACGGLMLLLSAHHLGAMPLILSGELSTLRRHLLPVYRACQAGDPHLMAFAITEPGAGSDAEDGHGAAHYRPGVVARKVTGGWRLNGRKCFISGGDLAKTLTVFAALEGEGMESWTCFLVDARSSGFKRVRTELKMGMRASGAAELEFNEVFVADADVVGGLRQGWALNRATLNASRIPVASMGVGFARAACEIAIDFARHYRLANKPLIDYQEVQLQLASLLAETRALRALIWNEARGAWRPRQLTASVCKFQATDRAQVVCEQALDLLGDWGGLHSQKLEKVLRDVRLTRIFEGTNQINRLAVIEDWQAQLLNPQQTTIGV